MYNEHRNPFYTDEMNLDVAIGAIEFRDETIRNLRQQIKNLRDCLDNINIPEDHQNEWQFSHLK